MSPMKWVSHLRAREQVVRLAPPAEEEEEDGGEAMQLRRMAVWLAMAETTQPPLLQSRW